MPSQTFDDTRWMQMALDLAQRGVGNVAPNPSVACLLVKNNTLVARGWTQPGGRPHAEVVALNSAGSEAKGATAYVTLEPCSHTGKTPPCAEALIKAEVSRVVVAAIDTDPRVRGKGNRMLVDAGVEVTTGVLEQEARSLNAGFFLKTEENRPFIALKMATTIDGKIAMPSGESRWITGPEARRFGHMLRAKHDAILVGVNTILADDPDLTCRVNGLAEASPVRIILDTHLKTPPKANVFKDTISSPVWVIHQDDASLDKAETLAKAGAKLIAVDDIRDLTLVLRKLSQAGLTRVLVEGGGSVHASFLQSEYVDCLYHFTAGKMLGAAGIPSVGELGLAELADAPHFTLKSYRKVGQDLLATYSKAE